MVINKIKILALLFLVIFTFNVNAIDNEYCLKLEAIIMKHNTHNALIKWVDERFSDSLISNKQATTYSSGIRPGKYTFLGHDFNWSTLNFNVEKSRIKLIGLGISDFYEDYDPESGDNKTVEESRKPANSNAIESIFFSEKSYYGILIKLKNSDKFIDEKHKNYVNVISDRIGILCGSKYVRGQ